jgi:hypothetical protein
MKVRIIDISGSALVPLNQPTEPRGVRRLELKVSSLSRERRLIIKK